MERQISLLIGTRVANYMPFRDTKSDMFFLHIEQFLLVMAAWPAGFAEICGYFRMARPRQYRQGSK